MNSTDALKQYAELRDSISAERERLMARLREIDAAIGATDLRGRPSYQSGSAAGAPRARNDMSLKETVIKVLSGGKSLTKHEILEAVLATGYQFTTSDPINSLGVVIYGKSPKFKKVKKRFSLA
jgi:hypothetical protein